MKKIALIAMFIAAAATAAEPRIELTKHNFTGAAWNDTGSICQPCHTPHNATPGYPRLWSRNAGPDVTYTPYRADTWDHDGDPTTPEVAEYAITQTTRMCLSCHDGVSALESFAGNEAGTTTNLVDLDGTTNMNIGTDLSNDHPVGFAYQNGRYTTDYVLDSRGRAKVNGTLPLKADADGNQIMECTTCHNPHGAGTGTVAGGDLVNFKSLLRLDPSATGDALCGQCHTK